MNVNIPNTGWSTRFEEAEQDRDTRYMDMALALSRRGLGLAAPNPSVGVVIVRHSFEKSIVVGRGVTASGGRPHAERIALDEAASLALGATMYVTLEPCARRSIVRDGPSCTDAALAAGIGRVVIGALDPSPFAAGEGIRRLKSHGISVTSGIRADVARRINLGHILRVTEGRPLVLLKLACTMDGFAATADRQPLRITSDCATARVHLMRAQSDAIAVGISTVLADDPALTCRLPGLAARSPVRVVFDSDLRIPLNSVLVRTARDIPTWVIAGLGASAENERRLVAGGVEVMRVDHRADGLDLAAALRLLGDRGVTRLMVEGGPALADSFAKAGLIEETAIFTAEKSSGSGLPAIRTALAAHLAACELEGCSETQKLGPDLLQRYFTRNC